MHYTIPCNGAVAAPYSVNCINTVIFFIGTLTFVEGFIFVKIKKYITLVLNAGIALYVYMLVYVEKQIQL